MTLPSCCPNSTLERDRDSITECVFVRISVCSVRSETSVITEDLKEKEVVPIVLQASSSGTLSHINMVCT